jgi:hypothetical protein
VEVAVIPKRKTKIDEDMTLNLYQMGLLFKQNPPEFRHWTSDINSDI